MEPELCPQEPEDLALWDDIETDHEMHLNMSDDDNEDGAYCFESVRASPPPSTSAITLVEDGMATVADDDAPEEPELDTVRDDALDCLEDLVLSFLVQLHDALPTAYSQSSKARRNAGKKIVLQLVNRTKEVIDDQTPMRTLVFPRRGPVPSARAFVQLFRVVDLLHEALIDDLPTTKRDMYYKDVQVFGSQRTVDRLVDDLAATFGLSRANLNVRASSKGLMCGSGFTVHLTSGDSIEISDGEACLIPQSEDIERFEVGDNLAWVLIVEKEAVFQTLCRLRFAVQETLPGPGLIVTGKGYPDVATRQLVKTLSDNLPERIPILALVDGDAYGIDILSVYRHGSMRMQHENMHLAAGRVQWLGLWASELTTLGIDKDVLLPITKHDEKKARSMLKRESLPAQWRRELQYMLFSRRKAEIEVLGTLRSSGECITDLGIGLSGQDPLHGIGKSGAPLVRYLVWKICAACAEADPVIL